MRNRANLYTKGREIMPRSLSTPEIYLYLNVGLEPKDIIKLGYSRQSVYNYHRRFKEAQRKLVYRLIGNDGKKAKKNV